MEDEPEQQPLQHESKENSNEVIESGLLFFTKLAQTLSNKEATESLIKSITEKDEKGKTYMKIPVESEESIKTVVTMFGALVQAIGGIKK